MLISKEVKKLITPRVAKKYRDLGYDLPNNIPRKGIEIFVKVNDLSTNSKDKIQYECDNCHNVFYTEYGVYKSHLHEDNKYYCKPFKDTAYNAKYLELITVGENNFHGNFIRKWLLKGCTITYKRAVDLENLFLKLELDPTNINDIKKARTLATYKI